MTLVESLEAEESRCGACSGCGPFLLPPYSGYVVRGVADGGFSNIGLVGQYIVLGDAGGEFQVDVGDSAGRVRESDEAGLDLTTKWGSPKQRLDVSMGQRNEVDTSHALPCSVLCSQRGRQRRRPKIVEYAMYTGIKADARSIVTMMIEDLLENAEEPPLTRDGQYHGA
jgi:hypothetical protein